MSLLSPISSKGVEYKSVASHPRLERRGSDFKPRLLGGVASVNLSIRRNSLFFLLPLRGSPYLVKRFLGI